MIKLYGIVDGDQSPLLIKYDQHISVISLYQSAEAATAAFKQVGGQWKDASDYRAVEWEPAHIKALHETEKRLGIRVVMHISQ